MNYTLLILLSVFAGFPGDESVRLTVRCTTCRDVALLTFTLSHQSKKENYQLCMPASVRAAVPHLSWDHPAYVTAFHFLRSYTKAFIKQLRN